MSEESKIAKNRELIKNFLVNKPIPKEYQLENPLEIPFGYIYCIENKINGKKYIGSVYSAWVGSKAPVLSQLSKRASNYLYEYNYNLESISKNGTAKYNRPIIKVMIDDGFENFIMYPIAETTKDTHNAAEKFFINKFNTIANGYNVLNTGAGTKRIGTKLMAKDKQLRS